MKELIEDREQSRRDAVHAESGMETEERQRAELKSKRIEREQMIESYVHSVVLHHQRCAAWSAKRKAIDRLSEGTFVLVDGRLQYKDRTIPPQRVPPKDPRSHLSHSPLLRSLIAPESHRDWKCDESSVPQLPTGRYTISFHLLSHLTRSFGFQSLKRTRFLSIDS